MRFPIYVISNAIEKGVMSLMGIGLSADELMRDLATLPGRGENCGTWHAR